MAPEEFMSETLMWKSLQDKLVSFTSSRRSHGLVGYNIVIFVCRLKRQNRLQVQAWTLPITFYQYRSPCAVISVDCQ